MEYIDFEYRIDYKGYEEFICPLCYKPSEKQAHDSCHYYEKALADRLSEVEYI